MLFEHMSPEEQTLYLNAIEERKFQRTEKVAMNQQMDLAMYQEAVERNRRSGSYDDAKCI